MLKLKKCWKDSVLSTFALNVLHSRVVYFCFELPLWGHVIASTPKFRTLIFFEFLSENFARESLEPFCNKSLKVYMMNPFYCHDEVY